MNICIPRYIGIYEGWRLSRGNYFFMAGVIDHEET